MRAVDLVVAVLAALLGVTVGLLAFAAFLAATDAHAHDAPVSVSQPTGWSYPSECCSGVDCRAVAPAWIEEGRAGYTIVPTGETITMTDTRIKESPDSEYHWCSVAGRDDSRTICLFVPPMGS